MVFTASDDDMPARLEQNKLVLATLASFGQDMSRFTFLLEEGTHSATYRQQNEDGENVFALRVVEFIKATLNA